MAGEGYGWDDRGNPTSPRGRYAAYPEDSPAKPVSFGGSLGWTLLGTLIPGVGLMRGGRKLAGGLVLALVITAVLALGTVAYVDRRALVGLAVDPRGLRVMAVGLGALALLWVLLIVATHLAVRPSGLRAGRRLVGGLLVAVLSFGVAAPLGVAALYSVDQASMISTVFAGSESRSQTRPTFTQGPRSDPWANKPRVNVLLLGGDSGVGRSALFGARTDTIMVASIDTKTGNTVLLSIPRNTARMPFPADSPLHKKWPTGFWDGVTGDNEEYMANAIWMNVPDQVDPDILGPTDNLGADALKLAVGEAVGLKMDYFAFVNIDGLWGMIDAIGGVTVNVNTRIPMAGDSEGKPPTGWLEPGPDQHLDAYQAMWYARSRSASSDFERMGRQRCVVNAILRQANPTTLLTRYEQISAAGTAMVSTDIPQDLLAPFLELGLKVRNAPNGIRSMQFTSGEDGFISADPDFKAMARRVAKAIAESEAPAVVATPSAGATPALTPSPTKRPSSGSATTQDLTDACAYRPE